MDSNTTGIKRSDARWSYHNVWLVCKLTQAFQECGLPRAGLACKKNMTGSGIDKLCCSREKIFHRDKLLIPREFAKKQIRMNKKVSTRSNDLTDQLEI